MNEHDAPITDEKLEQPPELPPIPDGGLAKGMPPWLAEPPARPSKLSGEPEPLDMQLLTGSAEVPQWLKDLSDRVDRDNGVAPPDDVIPAAELPVEAQVAAVEEIVEEQEAFPIQTTDIDEVAVPPVVVPSALTPEPKKEAIPEPRPLSEMKADVAPEPRPRSTYLLYALAIVVIAALAAWLIWG